MIAVHVQAPIVDDERPSLAGPADDGRQVAATERVDHLHQRRGRRALAGGARDAADQVAQRALGIERQPRRALADRGEQREHDVGQRVSLRRVEERLAVEELLGEHQRVVAEVAALRRRGELAKHVAAVAAGEAGAHRSGGMQRPARRAAHGVSRAASQACQLRCWVAVAGNGTTT